MRWVVLLSAVIGLAACDVTTTAPAPVTTPASAIPASTAQPISSAQADRNFQTVAARVEPVAERECRNRTRGLNCDFRIVVDSRSGQPPNAFQSLEEGGRPRITFTRALIRDTRNADELAFVMSHEAAHHIRNHLFRQEQNAAAGAVIFAGLATLTGGSSADVEEALQLGAAVGARSYSKEFELEADALGAVITERAGFDALRGADYFARIPDPGNRFLGTHPPNAQRYETVRRTVAGL